MQVPDNLSAQSGLIGAPKPMSIKTVLAAQIRRVGALAPGAGLITERDVEGSARRAGTAVPAA